MPRELKLPPYAKYLGGGRIEIDAAASNGAWLAELKVEEKDIDQYWLAVAKVCRRFEVEACVTDTGIVPVGGALVLLVQDNTKAKANGVILSKYAMARYPEGKGQAVGVKEAREHYKRLRSGA